MSGSRSIAEKLASAVAADDWVLVFAVFDQSWNELFHSHPAVLLDALERMPDAVIDQQPKLRLAMEYIGRNVKGEGYSTSYRNSVTLPDHLDAVNQLAAWTAQVAGARESGRSAEAARLVAGAQTFLKQQPTETEPLLAAALPEFHFQWGLALELAGDFDGAMAEYNGAYDWAVSTDHWMIESSAAGAIAFLHALHGRNALATAWRGRVPDDSVAGWWSTAAAIPALLADAMIRLDSLDFVGAARAMEQITPGSAAERWAPYFLLRAATETQPARVRVVMSELDSHLETIPVDRRESGSNGEYLALTRIILNLALRRPIGEETAFAGDRPTAKASLLRQYGAILRALRLQSAGKMKDARRLAAPLLRTDGSRPRVLIGALAASGDESNPQLEEAAELARAHASFGILALASASVRSRVAELLPSTSAVAKALTHVDAEDARPAGLALLSAREREVAERAATGESATQIAAFLHVSPNTVKTQLRASYRKLGVKSRAELFEALHHVNR
ncbi:helix-turn-helix transcriptional regulator [Herbiconiux ginsengi]|uniref:Regulatory protein, luxR family n=1 Tax=Herbiconiux ginsengi TaxID=381665 RepID=A0A1H3SR07_9MICO|nr:LuxR C-terminal-related transcriptional regulator [Herbiconiux ginsengi]SDZ39549.1 regulatory protein, luxR family [Herbiconiux ginsengi]